MQRSQSSVSELAGRYGLNEKTVRKWRKRPTVEDARMDPKEVRSSVLSPEEEAMCVAFRRHTLLPLDDCLYALQASIPHLSRSALHRLFQRHRVHTVLIDNGIQFTNRLRDQYAFAHAFRIACAEHGIEHRPTKGNHPWPNGQVERMTGRSRRVRPQADPGDRRRPNVKRYHYGSHDQLRTHLADFVAAYNFARQLKTLRGLTPYEHVVKCWTDERERFKIDPRHHMTGPNT
ncbi:DDE-type integrase/transposase/recombinase [Jannaschia formosa]|uniref:DDE-type integrase/transposase/recombinase n=1 Tax=Jannaschia formosa TaxID=2259592 RepID=UPI000E1B6AD6|nr:DDE-type integrase/transposase/recombinase [Jannaschia formosa]TFL16574.1 hypothetical protein DR046_19450 [Jannaschia formosa]